MKEWIELGCQMVSNVCKNCEPTCVQYISVVCTAASCTVGYLCCGTESNSYDEKRCFKMKRAAVKRLVRNYRVPKFVVVSAMFDIKSEIEEKVATEMSTEFIKVLRSNRKPLIVQLNEHWEQSKDSPTDNFIMELLISEPLE